MASARAFVSELGPEPIDFETVVDICDLTPHRSDWRIWYDEQENYVKLNEKSIRIHINKTPKENTTRNIFIKSLPNIIAKNSYWLMFMEKDNNKILSFVGNDGLIRVCYFENNIWKRNYLPLYLGIDVLNIINNGYLNLDMEKVSVSSSFFKSSSAWIGGWPSADWKGKVDCQI